MRFFDFIQQNNIGYALSFLMAVVAVKKKEDWGDVACHLMIAASWSLIVWTTMNSYKDWRLIAMAVCLASGVCFGLHAWLWPSKVSQIPVATSVDYRTLADDTTKFSSRLRLFEDDYQEQSKDALVRPDRSLSKKAREAAWSLQMRMSEKVTERYNANFKRNYYPEAVTLSKKLCEALKLPPESLRLDPRESDLQKIVALSVLNTGIPAGVDPLHCLAEFLDDMARRLPGVKTPNRR